MSDAKLIQPIVGGRHTDQWAVFSATHAGSAVYGLWCQVRQAYTNNIQS